MFVLRWTTAAIIAGLLSLSVVPAARAESEEAVVKKITGLNTSALAAYKAKDFEKARTQLFDAVVLGKENGLNTNPVMARTYLHLGLVHLEGLKEPDKAARYFTLAVRIRPDIEPAASLSSPAVKEALASARGQNPPPAEPAEPAASAEPAAPASTARDQQEKDWLARDLAREREARDKLVKDNEDKEKQIAKARESSARERESADRLEKELAAVKEREAKERDARDKLESDKQGKEKQLADALEREKREKEAKERLDKEKKEVEKQLAEAVDREKKEREAKEKLQGEKQQAEAKEKERKDREEAARLAREKTFEGPDLPGNFSQPVTCQTVDEGFIGSDLFVHCATQATVKAKTLALYYRAPGNFHYNSQVMDRSKKGWFVGIIPPASTGGKTLQYYVEALDGKGEVVASQAKANSPNIVPLRPGRPPDPPPAVAAAEPAKEKLTKASSRKARKARKN